MSHEKDTGAPHNSPSRLWKESLSEANKLKFLGILFEDQLFLWPQLR